MHLLIRIPEQKLYVFSDRGKESDTKYSISTSSFGVGQEKGSYQTPVGRHIIRAKIGAGMPAKSVFVNRRPTGEIYSENLGKQYPNRDWILTRILWLSGCEKGINRLGPVDTMQRFIYIHGTADESSIGRPHSHGCIRMRNQDIIELFDIVIVATPVLIEP
ncbi:MAG: L,D-transpeptidase [Gammaproteobacteria bacterium]|nr:L,D-transpeptidase [Gammaproteobacteria bacterium]